MRFMESRGHLPVVDLIGGLSPPRFSTSFGQVLLWAEAGKHEGPSFTMRRRALSAKFHGNVG